MSGRADRRAARDAARADRKRAAVEKKRSLAEAALATVPPGEAATPQDRGFGSCPCPKDCTLHGECLLCVAYHGRSERLPRCRR